MREDGFGRWQGLRAAMPEPSGPWGLRARCAEAGRGPARVMSLLGSFALSDPGKARRCSRVMGGVELDAQEVAPHAASRNQ